MVKTKTIKGSENIEKWKRQRAIDNQRENERRRVLHEAGRWKRSSKVKAHFRKIKGKTIIVKSYFRRIKRKR